MIYYLVLQRLLLPRVETQTYTIFPSAAIRRFVFDRAILAVGQRGMSKLKR
jgi:hypothetical protein